MAKKGIQVYVEEDAGVGAKFSNADYELMGANVVKRKDLFALSNVIFKVRPPLLEKETKLFMDGSCLISFLYPAQNKELIDDLSHKGMNVFSVDCIPRISRAQAYDALSSMANIAGYDYCYITEI